MLEEVRQRPFSRRRDANEDGTDAQERTRLIRDGFANYSSTVLSGALGLVLVPVMVHHLGASGYGIWVAAVAVAGLVAILDASLAWVVTQNAAAGGEDSAQVLSALWTLYLALGVGGLAVIGLGGLLISPNLHLSSGRIGVARVVFALIAVSFVTDQATAYSSSALAGLRRFVPLNVISVISAAIRVAGIVALLETGGGLTAVAGWQLASSAIGAAIMTSLLVRAQPVYRPRLATLSGLRSLQPHLWFGMNSLAATGASGMILQAPSILVGLLKGTAALTVYNVGQRFPLVASMLVWQAGEVVFPAVGQPASDGLHRVRQARLLRASVRAVLLVAVPLCIIGASLSQPLLQAWLGHVDSKSVAIMQIGIVTLAVDAPGMPAMLVLWGAGAVRDVAVLLGLFTAVLLAAGTLLIGFSGIVAIAWLIAGLTAVTSLAFIRRACQVVDVPPRSLLYEARGLVLPALVCAAIALSVVYLGLPHRWPEVAAVGLLAFLGYGISFLVAGAAPWERQLAFRLLPLTPARSAYAFMLVLAKTFYERKRRVGSELSRAYGVQDPWNYASPRGERRFDRELGLIASAVPSGNLPAVLEIGCGEGHFTERLASRCQALLAVDINQVALARARQRCVHLRNVRFQSWDLCDGTLLGEFDLVIATSVLEYIRSPMALRRARSRLAASIGEGGWLLIGNVQQPELIERARWDRYLLRGARHVNDFIARHPDLYLIREASGEGYLESLLWKPVVDS